MLHFKLTMILSTIILSSLLQANDEEGKMLFNEAKCVKCHKTENFKPEKSKITTFKKLSKRVKGCAINTGAQWFDEDADSVTKYLNNQYYHFK